MISSTQRIRIYGAAIIIFVLLAGITMNISAGSKYEDIRLLNAVRSFANAVERYKHDIWQYPPGDSIDLRNPVMLSERGFTAGKTMYYAGSIPSGHPVIYHTDGKTYAISFTLREAWPDQGIATKKCTISEFAVLSCAK